MTTINLHVDDPAVWRYICALQHEEAVGQIMAVQCAECANRRRTTKLGLAANTAQGPGFAASWADWEVEWGEVHVSGRKLGARETLSHLLDSATTVTGDWGKTREGYFAALAIPPELTQEYVPLLVRCPRHGDALLNRDAVVAGLRRQQRVFLARPAGGVRLDVVPQQVEGLRHGERKHASLTTTFGAGQGLPLEEFKAWYAAQPGGRDLRDTPSK